MSILVTKSRYDHINSLFTSLSMEKYKAGVPMGREFAFQITKEKFMSLQEDFGDNAKSFFDSAIQSHGFYLVNDIGVLSGWAGLRHIRKGKVTNYIVYMS